MPNTRTPKRPYRGMRGDYVVEQLMPRDGVWTVVVGAATRERAAAQARLYPGETRVTDNRPGAPMRDGSYRP